SAIRNAAHLLPCHSAFVSADPAPHWLPPLSLHDALPISKVMPAPAGAPLVVSTAELAESVTGLWKATDPPVVVMLLPSVVAFHRDRKSTRLNSSHRTISYAVFCLKKKNTKNKLTDPANAR